MSTDTTSAAQTGSDPTRAAGDTLRLQVAGNAWRIRPGWREPLFAADAPSWFSLEKDARAERIKAGRSRIVWRVPFRDRILFAKVVEVGSLRERIKHRLGWGSTRREGRMALRVEARGVPAPRAVAWGFRSAAPSRSIYLSEAIDHAVTLSEAWDDQVTARTPATRRAAALPLIQTVARLYALAHQRGFAHHDGHPRNVLVREEAHDHGSAFFVDVHGARLSRGAVDDSRTSAALAQLDHYFQRVATRAERLRFWKSYLACRTDLRWNTLGRKEVRIRLAAIAAAKSAHARALARQRDRRLRRNGPYFATIRIDGRWSATVALKLERRHRFAEADVPDRTVAQWRALLPSWITSARTAPPTNRVLSQVDLVVEWLHPQGLLQRWLWTLGGSPYRKVFDRCHRQRHRDVAAELLLGYAEHRTAGLVDAALLIRPAKSGNSTTSVAALN